MYNLDLDLCLAYKKTYFKDYLREIADLKNETIIAPSKSKNESILLAKEFKKANIPLNIAIESSSYKTSLNYAKSGLGVALIPIAYTNKESVEVIPLKIKKSLFLYFIDNTISPTTEVFLKDLKENFGIN